MTDITKTDPALRLGYAHEATGGQGGTFYYPHNTQTLIDACEGDHKKTLILDGQTNFDLEGQKLYVGSNTTIMGGIGTSILHGELRIQGEKNVVLYHLRFRDTVGDAITVRNSDLVHCSWITVDNKNAGTNKHGGTADGALDVVDAPSGGSRVTMAFSKIMRHHKAHLIGWSDRENDSKIRLTLYRNYYHNVNRRIPQVNRAWVHMRNCYIWYDDACVASYEKGRVWMDRCFIVSNEGRSPCAEVKSSGKSNGYVGFSGCLYSMTKHYNYKKEKAKAAKNYWWQMPRLSKSWSSAQKIKEQSGMQYK